jgi:glycerol-3-phosphate acyltransferase PlsY
VATALGVQWGLDWPVGLTVAAVWLFMAYVVKISSLSALVSMALAPAIVWYFWPEPALIGMQVLITLMLFWRHRSNIHNLLTGAEDRIGNTEGD